jgi:hypothetical protein
MTIIDERPTDTYRLAVVDLYGNIHKGIRSELFALVESAGRTDPRDELGRAALAGHIADVAYVLESHAHHEDEVIDPVLQVHLPGLAETITDDHERLEHRFARVLDLGRSVAEPGDERRTMQQLHLDLAAFTSDYLAHQDVEERQVMPALEDAIGPDAVLGLHLAIVSSIPPQDMVRSLAFMLPAMNVDDRTELLGGMKATAPAPVFEGVWGLAGTVLDPADHAAVGRRLGLA